MLVRDEKCYINWYNDNLYNFVEFDFIFNCVYNKDRLWCARYTGKWKRDEQKKTQV